MSNIFVVTRNQAFFRHLEKALGGTWHRLTRLDTTGDLPDERGQSEKTVHLVVLDVAFSTTWASTAHSLTKDHGLKVIVVSAHPTGAEAVRALAYLRGGTALDYVPMNASEEDLADTIQRALAY